jgi:hypothetical protein
VSAQGVTATAVTDTESGRGRAVADKTKVRTTITPDAVIEVGPAELLDLERSGLIYSRADRKATRKGEHDWVSGETETITSGVITDAPTEGAAQ